VRGNGHSPGDGPECPESPAHGRTYVAPSGNLWCPVSNALYGRSPDGRTVGPQLRAPEVKKEA
jgi:hypothetical protein